MTFYSYFDGRCKDFKVERNIEIMVTYNICNVSI